MSRDVTALAQRIEVAAAAAGKLSGEDYIFSRIAAGESIRKIMDSFGMGRTWFYDWLDHDGKGEERRERLANARKDAAPAMLERGRDKLEDLDERGGFTNTEVSLANSMANYYAKLAEFYDPERFGRRNAQLNVSLSIENLHLDALRRAGGAAEIPPGVKVLPAQILDEHVEERTQKAEEIRANRES